MALPPNASPNASRIDRRFDVLRSKVEQDAGAAQQQAQEGLARKAVAGGNQNSGAFIKLQGQQTDELNKQKQNALSDVEAQREGAQAQADEIQAQRDFAKSEREAGQDFASYQAQLGRKFEADEAFRNRAFTSKESALQRGFSEKLFNKEMNFKKQVQKDANSQFAKQFKMASEQFDFDKEVSKFNMDMATKQFNKKSMTESLIGGGFLGEKAGSVVGGWTGQDNLGAGFGSGSF
jgi:hypothetical protein